MHKAHRRLSKVFALSPVEELQTELVIAKAELSLANSKLHALTVELEDLKKEILEAHNASAPASYQHCIGLKLIAERAEKERDKALTEAARLRNKHEK